MTNQDFSVDSDVLDEHERLVKAGFDFCLNFPHLSSAQFRCLFHNVQSIHAHFADIRSCILYANCHLLIFCETWTTRSDNIENFNLTGYRLVSFMFEHCDERRPRSGMCLFNSEKIPLGNVSIEELAREKVHMLKIECKIESSFVKILVVHRRPRLTILATLIMVLSTVLGSFSADIVVGDLNENVGVRGESACALHSFFLQMGYSLLTRNFTTVRFTHLDVLYSKSHVNADTLEPYFSFHLLIFVEVDKTC